MNNSLMYGIICAGLLVLLTGSTYAAVVWYAGPASTSDEYVISGLGTPTAADDLATKAYVDSLARGSCYIDEYDTILWDTSNNISICTSCSGIVTGVWIDPTTGSTTSYLHLDGQSSDAMTQNGATFQWIYMATFESSLRFALSRSGGTFALVKIRYCLDQ